MAAACSTTSASPRASGPANVVIAYGDSITREASAVLAADLPKPGWRAIVRAVPGAALCDFSSRGEGGSQMEHDEQTLHPRLVVMAFAGTLITPCTRGRGTRELVYAADSETVATLWQAKGVKVLWATPPWFTYVEEIYIAAAKRHGQYVSFAGENLIDPSARGYPPTYPPTLPCLPWEGPDRGCQPDRRIVVHTPPPPNPHLCPRAYDIRRGPCTVYSSGVQRWAGQIGHDAQLFE
jgi:hypothetical protein